MRGKGKYCSYNKAEQSRTKYNNLFHSSLDYFIIQLNFFLNSQLESAYHRRFNLDELVVFMKLHKSYIDNPLVSRIKSNKIASSKRKLGWASAMLLL